MSMTYEWGGDAVHWNSKDRCAETFRRPEQVMRCVCKSGHAGRHRYGNMFEPGRIPVSATGGAK